MTDTFFDTVILGLRICANCGEYDLDKNWLRVDSAHEGPFHFHHYRLDLDAGSWQCANCKAVNTIIHADLSENLGPFELEALVSGGNTEHGEYFYPEFVVRQHGDFRTHSAVPAGQFEFSEPEPAIAVALDAARELITAVIESNNL